MPDGKNVVAPHVPRKPREYPVADLAWLDAALLLGRSDRFSDIAVVVPDMAHILMEMNTNNRPVHKMALSRYAEILTAGDWILTTESVSISYQGVLLNGQHRLLAIIASGVPALITFWFGCEPEEFNVIDQNGVRVAQDLIAHQGLNHAAERGTLARHVLRMETHERAQHAQKVNAKATAMTQEPGTIVALLQGERLYHRKVAPRSSAMLGYYWIARHTAHPDRMPTFWDGLISGSYLPEKSLVLRLRDWLLSAASVKNKQDRTAKEAAAMIIVWNAWLQGHRRMPDLNWPHTAQLPDVL